jgi:hypothetical protein
MEFEEGQNAIRILSSAIVGYKWWVEAGEGRRKPKRVRTADEVPAAVKNATDDEDKAKHFWAFTVYNYNTETIQVLELKQQTIMRAIEAFVKNAKWGDPKKYEQPREMCAPIRNFIRSLMHMGLRNKVRKKGGKQ